MVKLKEVYMSYARDSWNEQYPRTVSADLMQCLTHQEPKPPCSPSGLQQRPNLLTPFAQDDVTDSASSDIPKCLACDLGTCKKHEIYQAPWNKGDPEHQSNAPLMPPPWERDISPQRLNTRPAEHPALMTHITNTFIGIHEPPPINPNKRSTVPASNVMLNFDNYERQEPSPDNAQGNAELYPPWQKSHADEHRKPVVRTLHAGSTIWSHTAQNNSTPLNTYHSQQQSSYSPNGFNTDIQGQHDIQHRLSYLERNRTSEWFKHQTFSPPKPPQSSQRSSKYNLSHQTENSRNPPPSHSDPLSTHNSLNFGHEPQPSPYRSHPPAQAERTGISSHRSRSQQHQLNHHPPAYHSHTPAEQSESYSQPMQGLNSSISTPRQHPSTKGISSSTLSPEQTFSTNNTTIGHSKGTLVQGPPKDVCDFLSRLDMKHYVPLFVRNKIDLEFLASGRLTETRLTRLGIEVLGDIWTILDACEELKVQGIAPVSRR